MFQDPEKSNFCGGFGGQIQNFQSGSREDRQRFEYNRPNKRQFEDRESFDKEEQDLRAKLRREQEERNFREQGLQGNQRDEAWNTRGKEGDIIKLNIASTRGKTTQILLFATAAKNLDTNNLSALRREA